VEIQAEAPLGGCVWPELHEEGGRVSMDAAGFRDYLECVEVARANRTVAQANAESVDALTDAYELTRRMAERRADVERWQREQLEREKRALWWENVLLKVGIVVGLGAAL